MHQAVPRRSLAIAAAVALLLGLLILAAPGVASAGSRPAR
jgi:hypothetical protein